MKRQISRGVFTGKTLVCLIDYKDNKIEGETECVATPTSNAIESCLNGPAQDTHKLDLSYSENM